MFADIGSEDLQKKCLDVIRELKLESAILRREKNIDDPTGENPLPILAKVTEEGNNIGDADSEAMAKM